MIISSYSALIVTFRHVSDVKQPDHVSVTAICSSFRALINAVGNVNGRVNCDSDTY